VSRKRKKWFKQKKPFKSRKVRLPILSSAGKMLSESNEEFYYILTNNGVKKFPNSEFG